MRVAKERLLNCGTERMSKSLRFIVQILKRLTSHQKTSPSTYNLCRGNKLRKAHLIVAVLLCVCSVLLTFGQNRKTLEALAVVDEQSRRRLAERLEQFIAHHRSKQWDKLFKLLDRQNAGNKTLEAFAKVMSEVGHLDFVTESATAEEPKGEAYRVYGCVTTRAFGDVRSVQGGVVAYLQNGDWYFTPYFLNYDSEAKPIPCKP